MLGINESDDHYVFSEVEHVFALLGFHSCAALFLITVGLIVILIHIWSNNCKLTNLLFYQFQSCMITSQWEFTELEGQEL